MKTRKSRKIKKQPWRLIKDWGSSHTKTVISLIISGGIAGWIVPKACDRLVDEIWPSIAEVTITRLNIIRTNRDQFPECHMELMIDNSEGAESTIELISWSYWNDKIIYNFESPEKIINIKRGKSTHDIPFRDIVLDTALMVLPKPDNFSLKLIYMQPDKKHLDSVIMNDQDLAKCTYWLTPFFENEEQGITFGGWKLDFDSKFFLSNSKSFQYDFPKIFISDKMMVSFNIALFIKNLMNKNSSYPIDIRIFKCRYGGIYAGIENDRKGELEIIQLPGEMFTRLNDYELRELFGSKPRINFENIREFLYLDFDKANDKSVYREYERNLRYTLLILIEDTTHLSEYFDRFQNFGFNAYCTRSKDFKGVVEYINTTYPDNDAILCAELFSKFREEINQTLADSGFVIYSPAHISSPDSIGIINNVKKVTGKNLGFMLNYTPLEKSEGIPTMIRTIPIFLMIDMNFYIDSIAVRNPGSK